MNALIFIKVQMVKYHQLYFNLLKIPKFWDKTKKFKKTKDLEQNE
jgi:hypothetical protein